MENTFKNEGEYNTSKMKVENVNTRGRKVQASSGVLGMEKPGARRWAKKNEMCMKRLQLKLKNTVRKNYKIYII